MSITPAKNTFLQRLLGAAALDAAIYEEVEADPSAITQAFAVVVLSSVAAGLGARTPGANTFENIVFVSIVALIAWAAWALVVFQIGSRVLPAPDTRVDVGQLLRTIGFSASPGLLRVLGMMEAIAIPVFVVASLWMLLAMIVAVRQALDFQSTARAVAVCVLGWMLALAIAVVLGLVFAPSVS